MAMSEPPGPPDITEMEVLDFDNYPPAPIRQRPSGLLIGVVVMALAIGLGVGYLVGHHHAQPAQKRASLSTPTKATPDDPVVATGNTCSDQLGNRLELGVEVLNSSSTTVILDRLLAILPESGLRAESTLVGTCGAVTEAPAFTVARLRPNATTFVRMTFEVLDQCPAALPVQLRLYYHHGQHHASTLLSDFPNLGRVPFSRCAPVKKLLPER